MLQQSAPAPFALVSAELAAVEDELKRRIASETSIFPEIAQYALFAGGKRIRPAMFLLASRMSRQAAEAAGREVLDAVEERSIATAAVFELIHAASLLHDDVIDEANLRRGRTAVNAYWGNKKCILLGDYLFLKGINAIVESQQTRVLPVILETITAMIEGEGREVDLKYQVEASDEDCTAICELKTAVLFANACQIGAMLAGATDEETHTLRTFGMNTGVAFQLFDDVLDYTGTDESLGKNALNDFNEGKPTVPLLHAIRNTEGEDRAYLVAKFQDEAPDRDVDIERVVGLLRETGAFDYTRDMAQGLIDEGKAGVMRFPETPERAAMLDLCDFILARQS